MTSYDYMFLVSRDEYKALHQARSEHDKLIESIKGDVNGGQVNHIEIGEGGKVIIKPTDITASSPNKKKMKESSQNDHAKNSENIPLNDMKITDVLHIPQSDGVPDVQSHPSNTRDVQSHFNTTNPNTSNISTQTENANTQYDIPNSEDKSTHVINNLTQANNDISQINPIRKRPSTISRLKSLPYLLPDVNRKRNEDTSQLTVKDVINAKLNTIQQKSKDRITKVDDETQYSPLSDDDEEMQSSSVIHDDDDDEEMNEEDFIYPSEIRNAKKVHIPPSKSRGEKIGLKNRKDVINKLKKKYKKVTKKKSIISSDSKKPSSTKNLMKKNMLKKNVNKTEIGKIIKDKLNTLNGVASTSARKRKMKPVDSEDEIEYIPNKRLIQQPKKAQVYT